MNYRMRKRLRLENYDYRRNGAYFVTVCTKDRVCLFWQQQNKYQPIEPTSPVAGAVINHMKGYVTKQIGFSPWQRSYNDHIIRNRNEYAAYWHYIENNPANWENDEFFSNNKL